MAHFGGGLPTVKGRLLAWHQPKDLPVPEEDRRHGWLFEQARDIWLVDDFESLVNHIFFGSAGYGGWLPVLRSAIESLGSDHLCFGADYPYGLREPRYVKKFLKTYRLLIFQVKILSLIHI